MLHFTRWLIKYKWGVQSQNATHHHDSTLMMSHWLVLLWRYRRLNIASKRIVLETGIQHLWAQNHWNTGTFSSRVKWRQHQIFSQDLGTVSIRGRTRSAKHDLLLTPTKWCYVPKPNWTSPSCNTKKLQSFDIIWVLQEHTVPYAANICSGDSVFKNTITHCFLCKLTYRQSCDKF